MAGDQIPRLLSIAGSDSGGGAGIQADLKAFARCGVHGMTALTAITAQNTRTVTAVHPIPPDMILEQVRAVAEDIGVDGVKIGMLGTVPTIEAVGRALDLLPGVPVVLDPVMVSESGARLLDADAQEALRALLPRVTAVTPNVPEARVLVKSSSADTASPEEIADLARQIQLLGPDFVVVTGGHRRDTVDVFFDGARLVEIEGARHPDGAAHGSGCTHSSALAAGLASGLAPLEAARMAKQVASDSVRDGLARIGGGAGPVDALGVGRRAAARAPGSPGEDGAAGAPGSRVDELA